MFMALIKVLDHKTLPVPVFHTQPGGTKAARNFWGKQKGKEDSHD